MAESRTRLFSSFFKYSPSAPRRPQACRCRAGHAAHACGPETAAAGVTHADWRPDPGPDPRSASPAAITAPPGRSRLRPGDHGSAEAIWAAVARTIATRSAFGG